MQKELIKVHPSDNVAVALIDLKAQNTVIFEGDSFKILSNTKAKHKVALEKLEKNDPNLACFCHCQLKTDNNKLSLARPHN